MLKIVADQDIPFIEHYFGQAGHLTLLPGRELTRNDVKEADILLVRSITKVGRELLEDTRVKFVASPTTGFDHFDTDWLEETGIAWSVAPGCNATAVVEYVLCSIAALETLNFLQRKSLRAAVIGVGKIGSQVANKLKLLGFDVVLCDPLRALSEPGFRSTPLEDLTSLDFITLHTPLTKSGPYPTFHMINKAFFSHQTENGILINTGRGSVIDFNDLKTAGTKLVWALDVWENEPFIDFSVLDTSVITTPHIAGYTVQSKYRAIEMMYQAALRHQVIPDKKIEPLVYPKKTLSFSGKNVSWRDVLLAIYNPLQTTALMKEKVIEHEGASFDLLRKSFIAAENRHEFAFTELVDVEMSDEDRRMWEALAEYPVTRQPPTKSTP